MSQVPDVNSWKVLAEKELREKPLESLNTQTPEGIEIKPLYTAEDLESVPEGTFRCL
jgi:methylmalonyl-CoA mutase